MAVDSGVLEQLEAQGMGVVREQQGLCALELAMSGAGALAVVGMDGVVSAPRGAAGSSHR